jgi:hypothetical protein
MTFFTAIGVGAMAVYLLERFYQKIIINTANLWALVLCLAVFLLLKSLLPLMPILISLDQLQLVGIILGIFGKVAHTGDSSKKYNLLFYLVTR